MNLLSLRAPGQATAQAWSWSLSLLVHGLAIAAAIGLVSDLRLASQPEPFRWEVSQVSGPSPSPQQSTRTMATRSSPAPEPAPRPAQEMIPEESRAVPPSPRTVPISRPAVQAMEASPPVMPIAAGTPIIASPVHGDANASPATQVSAAPTLAADSAMPQEMAQDSQSAPQTAELGQSTEAPQTASLSSGPQISSLESSTPATPVKADYGWLAQTLRSRIDSLKRYPTQARSNRWEGRVVLNAVIGESGQLVDLTVLESSGHPVLDNAAVEVLKQACPLSLPHPLGRPRIVVQVPISYQLH